MGTVQRTIHPQVPPKVEYQLTEIGEALRPTLRALLDWADLIAIDFIIAIPCSTQNIGIGASPEVVA
jgi:DNA-binding HxlR family transcriptional regulator